MYQDVDLTLHISEKVRAKHWTEPMKMLETGKITEQDFWQQFLTATQVKTELPPTSLLARKFIARFQINQDVVQIARELRTKHYTVGVMSNTIAPHLAFMRTTHLFDLFNPLIFSNEVGVAKPNPQIYTIILNTLKLQPEEVLFIDDLLENVEGANRVGIHGILYLNAEKLREDIKALGVEL